MNLRLLLFGTLSAAAAVNAQYFSAGWSPDQQTTKEPPSPVPTTVFTPQQQHQTVDTTADSRSLLSPASILKLLDLNKLLATGPSAALFSRFGINITEKLEEAAKESKLWDDRIPMITDANYHDLIVNEPLTQDEERTRTWILVITVSTSKEDSISKLLDKVFDDAYNATVASGDLPDVRWGRIDYFQVTALTTKWSVWNAPYLVLLRDRGKTLRFYRPYNLRLNADSLRTFLEREEWMMTPPWASPYAPGGPNEWMLDYLAIVLTKIYNVVIILPRWMLYLFTGGFATILIGLLHNPPRVMQGPKQEPGNGTQANPSSEPVKAEAQSSATGFSQTGKRRKGKGKNT